MLFDAADFVGIEGFPLAWRWTDERYVKMDASDLALIRPLRTESAAVAWQRIRELPKAFGVAEVFEGAPPGGDDHFATVRTWLEDHIHADSGDLLLLWSSDTAAVVSARLFARNWNDFWYPSSDDLDVVPVDERWMIRIHHDGSLLRFALSAG